MAGGGQLFIVPPEYYGGIGAANAIREGVGAYDKYKQGKNDKLDREKNNQVRDLQIKNLEMETELNADDMIIMRQAKSNGLASLTPEQRHVYFKRRFGTTTDPAQQDQLNDMQTQAIALDTLARVRKEFDPESAARIQQTIQGLTTEMKNGGVKVTWDSLKDGVAVGLAADPKALAAWTKLTVFGDIDGEAGIRKKEAAAQVQADANVGLTKANIRQSNSAAGLQDTQAWRIRNPIIDPGDTGGISGSIGGDGSGANAGIYKEIMNTMAGFGVDFPTFSKYIQGMPTSTAEKAKIQNALEQYAAKNGKQSDPLFSVLIAATKAGIEVDNKVLSSALVDMMNTTAGKPVAEIGMSEHWMPFGIGNKPTIKMLEDQPDPVAAVPQVNPQVQTAATAIQQKIQSGQMTIEQFQAQLATIPDGDPGKAVLTEALGLIQPAVVAQPEAELVKPAAPVVENKPVEKAAPVVKPAVAPVQKAPDKIKADNVHTTEQTEKLKRELAYKEDKLKTTAPGSFAEGLAQREIARLKTDIPTTTPAGIATQQIKVLEARLKVLIEQKNKLDVKDQQYRATGGKTTNVNLVVVERNIKKIVKDIEERQAIVRKALDK